MREMKDSGVEWIGEIPKEWTLSSVKREYRFQTGWTPSTERDEYFEGEHIWVNISDMREKTIYDSAKHISDEATRISSMSISPAGSLLFAFKLSIGNVAFAGCDLYTNEAIATFLPGANSLRYLYYTAPIFITENANENIYGAKLLNQQLISNAIILNPPVETQLRIADYLDAKCAQIDRAIARQQEVIEKLKEYKLSVITEAVTKGLNPDVPMKDSGIEWIGEIPEHWEVSRIKNEFILLDYLRKPISAENRENKIGLYDYYGASGVIDKIDDYNVEDTVLLIAEDGANLVLRNLPLVYKATGRFWVNNHAHILKAKSTNDYEYMAYLLECADFTRSISGSAQPKLTQSRIESFPIVVPPYDEQALISSRLRQLSMMYDSNIVYKKRIIDKLTEYKKSLIYDVVTGKREV